MKAVCIFLAEGFEEMEAMFPLDIMRRGGLNVKTVSVTGNKTVTSSHQVPIVADMLFEDLKEEEVEMIVLPGGLPGATNLDAHAGLDKLIMSFAAAGKPLAAICAAPMVYGKRGLLKGKKATCYPGFDKFLEGAEYTGNMVEIVDNFILGKGPGAAPAFGFAILEKYAGAEKTLEVKKECCWHNEEICHCGSGRKRPAYGGRDSQAVHTGKREIGTDAYAGGFSCL